MLFKKKYIRQGQIYYRQYIRKCDVCAFCIKNNECDNDSLNNCSATSRIFDKVYKRKMDCDDYIYNYRPYKLC